MNQLLYEQESYKILGACFEVYNTMGCGFLEAVYQECLEIELELQQIPFKSKAELSLSYKERELKQKYVPDLICYDKIIVELKAVSKIIGEHQAQLINYLNASGKNLGLLINFGFFPKLEYKRFVH